MNTAQRVLLSAIALGVTSFTTVAAQDLYFIDPIYHPGRVEECLAAADAEEATNAQSCRDHTSDALEIIPGFPEGPILTDFLDRIWTADERCHSLSLRLHFHRSSLCTRFQDPWLFARPFSPVAGLEWITYCSEPEVDCFDDIDFHFELWEPSEPGDPAEPGGPLGPLGEF